MYDSFQQEKALLAKTDLEESSPQTREAASKILLGQEEITREQLRQLVKLMVRRVEALVYLEGVFVRGRGTGLRRYVRVHLNIEGGDGVSIYLAAIFTNRYTDRKEEPFPDSSVSQDGSL